MASELGGRTEHRQCCGREGDRNSQHDDTFLAFCCRRRASGRLPAHSPRNVEDMIDVTLVIVEMERQPPLICPERGLRLVARSITY